MEDLVSKFFVVLLNLALDAFDFLESIAHSYTFYVAIKSMLLFLVKLLLYFLHIVLLVFTGILLELKVIL